MQTVSFREGNFSSFVFFFSGLTGMFLSPKQGGERTSDGRTVSIDGATTSDLAPAGRGAKGCGTETWGHGDFLAI